MKTIANLSLLLLAVLLAACSKDGNEEGAEPSLGPYELSVYPPKIVFYSDNFRHADIDESVFLDTLFIKGGTPPYRVEPVEEMYTIRQGEYRIQDMKTMDIFDFTVRSAPREADQVIVRYVYPETKPNGGPEFLLLFSMKFMIYDKNGGYAKFEVRDHDAMWR